MTDETNVVSFDGKAAKSAMVPNKELIAFLAEILGWAKEGRIQQAAVVWYGSDGFPGDGYAPGGTPRELYPIIAGLEVCKATLLSQMIGSGI